MTDNTPPLFDSMQALWSFEKAWQNWSAGKPPSMASFFPAQPPLRDYVVKLVEVDLEFRWRWANKIAAAAEMAAAEVAAVEVAAAEVAAKLAAAAAHGDPAHGEPAAMVEDSQGTDAERRLPAFPKLEDYVRHTPFLGPLTDLPPGLIVHEFNVRGKWGDQPTVEDFCRRFPAHDETLRSLLQLRASEQLARPLCLAPAPDQPVYETPAPDKPASHKAAPDSGPRMNSPPDKIGRYIVKRELGRGAFGEVYLCEHPNLELEVAVKIPCRSRDWTASQLGRFMDEARRMVKVRGPGIANVFDVFEETIDGRPSVCAIQEFIDGRTLGEWRGGQRQPIDPIRVARLVANIALILKPAHQEGIYHRDLKPGNILLKHDTDQPYILDFGLALHKERRLEELYIFAGTVPYMSPEQTRGESHRIDGRSDIWSLGVILYELLTGQLPFEGRTHQDRIFAIQCATPAPPRQRNASIPVELEAICQKCLHKAPDQRYTTVVDLADDLLGWRDWRHRPPTIRNRVTPWNSTTLEAIAARQPPRQPQVGRCNWRTRRYQQP